MNHWREKNKTKVNDQVLAYLSNFITITIEKKKKIIFFPFHKITGTIPKCTQWSWLEALQLSLIVSRDSDHCCCCCQLSKQLPCLRRLPGGVSPRLRDPTELHAGRLPASACRGTFARISHSLCAFAARPMETPVIVFAPADRQRPLATAVAAIAVAVLLLLFLLLAGNKETRHQVATLTASSWEVTQAAAGGPGSPHSISAVPPVIHPIIYRPEAPRRPCTNLMEPQQHLTTAGRRPYCDIKEEKS